MTGISRRTFNRNLATGAAAASLFPLGARAQIPDRPVRLICPWSAGGPIDTYLRGFAAVAEKHLGRRLVVENRPGAAGAIGTAYIKSQKPDGSAIVGLTDAPFQNSIIQQVQFDGLNDFTFLGGTAQVVHGYIVRADSPFKDMRDLIAAAKAAPGKIKIAAGGSPAQPPLVLSLLEYKTGAKFLLLSFTGGGEYINAVMSGEADFLGDGLGAAAGMVDSGQMRILGIAGEERSRRFPNVPTCREQGIDLVHRFGIGFIGPKGMPAEVVAAYDTAIQNTLADPAHDELLAKLNLEKWPRPPQAYEAHVREIYKVFPTIFREIGMLKT